MKKLAAIDIGTNTVLYSLFAVRGGERLTELHFERHSPRIGQMLKGERRPQITEERYRDVQRLLKRHLNHAGKNGAEAVLIAATNPLRLASNGRAVQKRLQSDLGVAVAIISPEEEARLSYLGAIGGYDENRTALVIDMGGGSTEFVSYKGHRRQVFLSVPEGAVSLTERFDSAGKIDPAAFPVYEAYLSLYGRRLARVRPYAVLDTILVGGTASALAAMKDSRFPGCPRGVLLGRNDIMRMIDHLADLSLSGRRRALAIDPKRAEIIFAGAFWLGFLYKSLRLSKARAVARGLRHGLALDYLKRGRFPA